jgi:hypothetical protein
MKAKHRAEVKAYKEWFKYSPFYLKHHPEAKSSGDIDDIQQLSQMKSANGDQLAGVEAVFEKHMGTFNNLIS